MLLAIMVAVGACGPAAKHAALGGAATAAAVDETAAARTASPAGTKAAEADETASSAQAASPAGTKAAEPEPAGTKAAEPPPGDPVVTVAAGARHVCALRRSGQVWCWGGNRQGQLGLGHRDQVLGPQRVPGIEDAVTLAVSGSQTCVMRQSNQVLCWGENRDNAIADNGKQPVVQPVAWPVSGQIRSLAVGSRSICALTQDGRVECRGSLYASGTETLSSVRELAMGESHGCALRTGGEVWCWGSESYGALGTGRSVLEVQPPLRVQGLEQVARLDSRDSVTCAVEVDGDVMCWGQAQHGTQSHLMLSPTRIARVDAPENLLLLSSGPCLRKPDGSIACIGIDGLEALAAGKPAVEHTLPGLPGQRWARITGASPMCAVSARGAVYCWGSNHYGELGTGTASLRWQPTPVRGVSDIERLAAGLGTCALVHDGRQGGRLHCWDVADAWSLSAALAAEGIEEPVVDVSMWSTMGCAVLVSGSVRCIGDRLQRSLGDGKERPKTVSNAERTSSGLVTIQGIDDAVAVALGPLQGCVIRKGGRVACWGSRGVAGSVDGGYLAAKDLPGLADAAAIAAGPEITCVIRRGGRVVCWGRVMRVQSHDGDWEPKSSARPVAIAGATGAVELGIERGVMRWACMRRRDGAVYCWSFDELYSPLSGREHLESTRAVRVPGIKNAVSLSVGDGYACAALASGKVACWGEVTTYENPALGPDAPPYDTHKPHLVPGIDDAVAVLATSHGYTCAVRKDRTASCWGWTGTVLGDGHQPYASTPVQVLLP